MKEIVDIRQPIVEGLFYPLEREETVKRIKELMDAAPTQEKKSKHLVLPHGGWDFTGEYIASGFKALGDHNYKRVVIISNVHREFTKEIILPDYKSFLVNGREIKVDRDAVKKIKKSGRKMKTSNIPHMEEHGIETILPFISHLYPEAKIIPILLGKTVVSLVRNLAEIVENLIDEDTLVIVSSNFSDYRREDQAKELGERGTDLTLQGKMADLVEESRTNKLEVCGAGAISSLILLKDYKSIDLIKGGLSKGTPLSMGKSTYYATISFSN